MSETPPEEEIPEEEFPADPAERLNNALLAFTACVGEAVGDICSYGLTIGETYVPFDPDPEDECEEDEVQCNQLWVRVTGITPSNTEIEGWDGSCAMGTSIGLEVGVIRCLEVPEGGEAPYASDVLVAATQAMTDMTLVRCAALSCEVWDGLDVGDWTPLGPQGGQVGGVMTFIAELD